MCVEIENIINKYMRQGRAGQHVDLLHFTVQMRMALDVIDDSIWLLFFASYSFVSNIYLHLLKLNWIQASGQMCLMHSVDLSLLWFSASHTEHSQHIAHSMSGIDLKHSECDLSFWFYLTFWRMRERGKSGKSHNKINYLPFSPKKNKKNKPIHHANRGWNPIQFRLMQFFGIFAEIVSFRRVREWRVDYAIKTYAWKNNKIR